MESGKIMRHLQFLLIAFILFNSYEALGKAITSKGIPAQTQNPAAQKNCEAMVNNHLKALNLTLEKLNTKENIQKFKTHFKNTPQLAEMKKACGYACPNCHTQYGCAPPPAICAVCCPF